jgi:hypothetical protein
MNFLVEPFDHVMDAIKMNGTMKTKLWKSLRNFGSHSRWQPQCILSELGRFSYLDFASVITRQQDGRRALPFCSSKELRISTDRVLRPAVQPP